MGYNMDSYPLGICAWCKEPLDKGPYYMGFCGQCCQDVYISFTNSKSKEEVKMTEVNKYENGDPKAHAGAKKITMTNIPLTMLPLVSIPMNDGAKPDKYGKYNWLSQPDNSMDMMVYLNGILRHILLCMAGQDYTSDSGVAHFTAIAAGASVASDAIFFGKMHDNRIKLTPEQLEKYEKLINNQLPNWIDALIKQVEE